MRAREVLVASSSAERGTVVLTHRAGRMDVIGASVPMTVNPGSEEVHSFGVCPEKGKDGVVAVFIRIDRGKRNCQWLEFMLPVCWRDDEPFVDLENAWVPSADRRGQAIGSHVNLYIDGQWFTTAGQLARSYGAEKHMRYLSDPNLALRYLVGDATAQEIIAAAEEAEAEISAQKQLKVVQGELKLLREQWMTLAELGLPDGATAQEIAERLRELGIKLPTLEEVQQRRKEGSSEGVPTIIRS